ncbi:hypothetical protein SAMN05444920_11641 [Nonomuraea solani]|uniref:Uncharacterized protein n=1 Tax=Nonomuraea solani TaxID=1144553 RepID=A0A1H6ER25_9ACTN|nr:hypothetical protein [Nonomuraea solani]SEH00307.1 hypothetical protein SAMN05444920_11641 [Nonomuraea solani]
MLNAIAQGGGSPKRFRQRMTEGVIPEDYHATVDVLRRMAGNLA